MQSTTQTNQMEPDAECANGDELEEMFVSFLKYLLNKPTWNNNGK